MLGRAGHLQGIEATSNKLGLRSIIHEAKTWGVEWQKEGRWVVGDGGRVWTSAGVTAGMDMVAAWLKAKKAEGGLEVDARLMGLVFSLLEFTPREREDGVFGHLWEGMEL